MYSRLRSVTYCGKATVKWSVSSELQLRRSHVRPDHQATINGIDQPSPSLLHSADCWEKDKAGLRNLDVPQRAMETAQQTPAPGTLSWKLSSHPITLLTFLFFRICTFLSPLHASKANSYDAYMAMVIYSKPLVNNH